MALPAYARNAKTPAEHHEVYLDLIGSSQGRGIPSSMMAAMKSHAQLVKALPAKDHSMLHKKISAHVNQLLRDDEISDDEASTVKAMYAPPTVKEGKDMELDDKEMTDAEMAKREKIVKSMKKGFKGFKQRYGERAKEVMYATATKQAMKSEETESLDEALFKNDPDLYLQHHPLKDDKPQLPAKIHSKHIHLQHIGGKVNSETAKYKVVANGKNSVASEMKVGSHISGSTANDLIDDARALPDHKVVIHTNKPHKDYMGESTQDVGQHFCAKHVLSNVFGEGVVLDGQHAEPDENGHVEWYTVQFDHGEEVIFAEDVEIMMAEFHNNHSPSKKKKAAQKKA